MTAKDITGLVSGELIALYPTEERSNNGVVWMCRCSCGKLHKVKSSNLIRKSVTSCGHPRESIGVTQIKNILNQNNIIFETEKTFKNFIDNITKRPYRYDFYLPEYNRIIEFDGKQHYEISGWDEYTEDFQERQKRDKIKNQYCKNHNISIVRIPYTKTNNITLEMLLGDDFLIT